MSSVTVEEKIQNGDAGLMDITRYWGDKAREETMATSSKTKTMAERLVLGDLQLPIKRGSPIISVDGESDDMGTLDFEKVGFLGRYVACEPVNPFLVRLRFTTKDGFYYEGTKNERHPKQEHPYSQQGYYIPYKDGIRVLDKGNVILVSRLGIFAQVRGYEQAERYLKQLIGEQQRSQKYMDLYNHSKIKLETVQGQIDDLYLTNYSLHESVRELKSMKTILIQAKGRAEGIAENLSAKVQYSEEVLDHQRRLLQSEVTEFQKYVSDILLYVERNEMDDSLRATRIQHPSLGMEFDKKMVEKWKRIGLISDVETERLKQRIAQLEKEVEDAEEREYLAKEREYTRESSVGDEESYEGTGSPGSPEEFVEGEGETKPSPFRDGLSKVGAKAKETGAKIVDTVGRGIEHLKGSKEEDDETEIVEPPEDDEPSGDEDTD